MDQAPSAPQPTEQQQPPPQPANAPAAVATTSSLRAPSTANQFPGPNPTPIPKPQTTVQPQQSANSQSKPSFNTRPWQQQPYSHFSLPSPPLPSSSASTPSSTAAPQPPRGGMAIGVPAHSPSAPSTAPTSFSSLTPPSYGQQAQIRQPLQGIGMTGTLGTTTSMRPAGVPHHMRPSQSSLRSQASPSIQSPVAQNFPGHGMLRASALGSPGSPSPSTSQSAQNQPWLSSGTQGKPPLPTPSHRPQMSPQSFQQRPHISQQHHHNMPATPQQISVSPSPLPPQSSTSGQPHELYTPQFPHPRSITHQQQQMSKASGLGSQRPNLGMTQSTALNPPGVPSKTITADAEETSNRIVSKRSIQELVNQIDPSEKLDPDVEDILVDIAEDFVESITTFGCSLAKHRKSATLEAKDILLHLERNWNMTLPGFGGDEIKTFKKPVVSDAHRERLGAVKKSMVANDTVTKSSGGPSGGNSKGNLAKGPASVIGSPPNPKIREAA